jgi:hypothetical protein
VSTVAAIAEVIGKQLKRTSGNDSDAKTRSASFRRYVYGGCWGQRLSRSLSIVEYAAEGGNNVFPFPSSVEKRRLITGDLAIEISGGSPTQSTGRPVLASSALLQSLGQPLVASNFCRIVKLKTPAHSKFVYCWLRRLYDAGEFYQFETGTTGIKNFAFVLFSEKYRLTVPDPRVAEAFDRNVSPLFERAQANALQSRTLATLRDTLLPKLLSGELRVTNLPKGPHP